MKLADGQLRFSEVPMSYVLAVDVGTSFTAAAIAKNDQPVPESLPLGLRGTAVPSVVYYPEEGPVLVGEAAERRGLDVPARVVREFKRRIGDSVPIAVGTLALPAEDIFATMARWVADRAEEREGAPPSEIIITHPAAWGGHRTTAVLAALAAKGLNNVTLISEPEAAALHYASQVRVEDGSTIAVYDLGGGTFDTAILKKAGNGRFDFLGSPDGIEGLGGADFDAAVLRYVASHTGEALAALDPEDPGALAALARLKRECVEAKEALSADSEANISVFLPGMQQQVRLVRSEFEAMIEEPIRETVDALERSLEQLGLEPADLSAVLLIGGSSRIPLVAQLISEQLDRPIAVDADPKSSICLGAAVAALRAAAGSAAGPADAAAGTVPAIPAPADLADEPHNADRRASWSRKPGFGSLAGTAAAGDGARGVAAGRRHGAKAGAHAPRPAIRLTAVAAGAALFTILTATAAQSPEGLGNLTAMFAPPAAPADASPGGGNGVAAAPGGSADAVQDPASGIEASAKKPADTIGSSVGLEAAASPSSKPSPAASSPAGTTPDAAAPASTPDGQGTKTEPTPAAAVPGTPAGTTPDTTTPPPSTTAPVTPAPTDPPPATQEPTTPPTTDPPPPTEPPTTPTPPPSTDPPPPTDTPVTPEPSAEPAPTTSAPPAPVPEPTATQTAAQTAEPTPDPTIVPAG
jgi:molecular chaperone DnaK